jgi:hypothetical protein
MITYLTAQVHICNFHQLHTSNNYVFKVGNKYFVYGFVNYFSVIPEDMDLINFKCSRNGITCSFIVGSNSLI